MACLAVTIVPFALTDKTAVEDIDLGCELDWLLLCRGGVGSGACLTRICGVINFFFVGLG